MARQNARAQADDAPELLDAESIEPHELFLPESEDDPIIGPPVLVYVSITRMQPYFENGGKCFPYAELPNVEAIGQRFGKGRYRVQARNVRKQVLAHREYTIARGGPPLPMDGNGAQEDAAASHAPAVEARAQQLAPSNSDAAILALERMATGNATQFKEVLLLVQEGNKNSLAQQAQFFENMFRLQQAAPKPAASAGESSGDPAEVFRNGMEFMQEMMENVIDKVTPPEKVRSADDDDGRGTIAMVVEGIKALGSVQQGSAPAAAAAALQKG